MGETFDRTSRSIATDRGGGWVAALLVGFGLLALWAAWMVLARVPLRVVSEEARIEAEQVPRRLQASVDGVVASVDVRLGDPVRAGQPLVQLDDADARAALSDAAALRDGLAEQIDRLTRSLDALAGASQLDAAARAAAAAAARADAEQGRVAAAEAVEEAARAEALAESGAIGAQELARARSRAQQLELDASAREAVFRKLTSERAGGERGGDVEIGRLEQELAALRAARERAGVAVGAAETDLARHAVVSPVDGRIGTLAVLDVGSVVGVGDPIATVVPEGTLRVVASFAPAAALGRIAPGQEARMRLDGFPWTAFGALSARVERIGEEPDGEGRIRVELALLPEPTRVPLQHGLPGQVEIDVERLAPASLVLRAAGRAAVGERSP